MVAFHHHDWRLGGKLLYLVKENVPLGRKAPALQPWPVSAQAWQAPHAWHGPAEALRKISAEHMGIL